MTNLITLTIPNDDHIALRAFGKALEEMALAHGAEPGVDPRFKCDKEFPAFEIPSVRTVENTYPIDNLLSPSDLTQIDTTSQQVESLAQQQEPLGKDFEKVLTDNLSDLYVESSPTTDSTGTPWDERIHSTSKALNADGTWRLRRKPKDMGEAGWIVFVDAVKDQLNGVPQSDEEDAEDSVNVEPTREEVDELIEASNEMLATIESPVTPPGDDFHTDAGVVTEQAVAGIPPIPVPPPVVVPPVPVADEAWTFPKLMVFLTDRNGKIDVPTINALLAVDGLAALTDLNAHPDKIGPFVARVKAHLGE